jgi:hypothetical protein
MHFSYTLLEFVYIISGSQAHICAYVKYLHTVLTHRLEVFHMCTLYHAVHTRTSNSMIILHHKITVALFIILRALRCVYDSPACWAFGIKVVYRYVDCSLPTRTDESSA